MALRTRTIFTEDLKVGMITAEEIIVGETVLVGKNIILTEHIIDKLQAFYSFSRLYIYINEKNNLKELAELKKVEGEFTNISNEVKSIFNNNSNLTIKTTIEIREYSKKLKNIIDTNNSILKNILLHGSKDDCIYRHSINVAALSSLIGKWAGFSQADCKSLITASMLHDFGKTKISNDILYKKEPLTKQELKIIKEHPTVSYKEIKKIPYISDNILFGVLMHHERCDGSGYPLGLKGDSIHPFGKIIAIADVFDALNSNRAYKDKKNPFEALNIIREESIKGKLDYNLCDIFLKGLSNFYIGQEVLLSNNLQAKIVQMDINNITYPLLISNNEFIDLKINTDITIIELL